MKPSRKQFTQVFAEAMWEHGLGHSPVMNQAQITYDLDTNDFGWGSSLTPTDDGEIVVVGDVDPSWFFHGGPELSEDEATALNELADCVYDELWQSVLDTIENAE